MVLRIICEALLGLFLYAFIGTLWAKIFGTIVDDEGSNGTITMGVFWPLTLPVCALIGVIIVAVFVSKEIIDKIGAIVTAMWEEWRA